MIFTLWPADMFVPTVLCLQAPVVHALHALGLIVH